MCKYSKCTSEKLELKFCSLCKKVQYCSRLCQQRDWKQHKTTCKKSNKMSNEYKIIEQFKSMLSPAMIAKNPELANKIEKLMKLSNQMKMSLKANEYKKNYPGHAATMKQSLVVGLSLHKNPTELTAIMEGLGFIDEPTQYIIEMEPSHQLYKIIPFHNELGMDRLSKKNVWAIISHKSDIKLIKDYLSQNDVNTSVDLMAGSGYFSCILSSMGIKSYAADVKPVNAVFPIVISDAFNKKHPLLKILDSKKTVLVLNWPDVGGVGKLGKLLLMRVQKLKFQYIITVHEQIRIIDYLVTLNERTIIGLCMLPNCTDSCDDIISMIPRLLQLIASDNKTGLPVLLNLGRLFALSGRNYFKAVTIALTLKPINMKKVLQLVTGFYKGSLTQECMEILSMRTSRGSDMSTETFAYLNKHYEPVDVPFKGITTVYKETGVLIDELFKYGGHMYPCIYRRRLL
jgi:hypothetical protein